MNVAARNSGMRGQDRLRKLQRVGAWDGLLNCVALGLSKGAVFDFRSLSLLHPLFPRFSASAAIPLPILSL